MSAADARQAGAVLHASAVMWHGVGVLACGPSGSGKSRLVLQLLAAGAYLVADDLVRVQPSGAGLRAESVRAPGLIEARGLGIFRVVTAPAAMLALVVRLLPKQNGERLPDRGTETILGVRLPAVELNAAAADLPARVMLALFARRAG